MGIFATRSSGFLHEILSSDSGRASVEGMEQMERFIVYIALVLAKFGVILFWVHRNTNDTSWFYMFYKQEANQMRLWAVIYP